MSRVARHWAALLLVWVVAGCATVSGKQVPPAWSEEVPRFSPSSSVPAPPSRRLLAMSDSPAVGGEPSDPVVQGYDVPGRDPNSQMPWKFFLGNAAHRLIAYMYGVNHPGNQ